jgi:hypothetical protein
VKIVRDASFRRVPPRTFIHQSRESKEFYTIPAPLRKYCTNTDSFNPFATPLQALLSAEASSSSLTTLLQRHPLQPHTYVPTLLSSTTSRHAQNSIVFSAHQTRPSSQVAFLTLTGPLQTHHTTRFYTPPNTHPIASHRIKSRLCAQRSQPQKRDRRLNYPSTEPCQ